MKIVERTAQEIGQSLLITLPKAWTRAMKLKKGSPLKIMVSERGQLTIAPEFTQTKERKEATIAYDHHFQRRFFREYFQGNETIRIHTRKTFSKRERDAITSFLQRFMNAQIIEEKPKTIVIRCFTIDELSIQECLKRMHYLVLNLFDTPSKELRDTTTRFYYLLVMQVRRYLDEGSYAKENQIPLIKALDARMIAEKIQRIARLLSETPARDKTIKEYYSKAFNCFITDRYGKTPALWQEGREHQHRLRASLRKTKSLKAYKELDSLLDLYTYAKEISMLVR